MTRSQGQKYHAGVDDPAYSSPATSRWTGTQIGTVTKAGSAYDSRGKYLGERVEIKTRDSSGVWTSKTLHHEKVFVKPGDPVFPGQPIARGAGVGSQFGTPGSGGPHVHWELNHNTQPVNPLNGAPLKPR